MSANLHTTAAKSADLHLTVQQICNIHGISRRMFFNALTVRRNGRNHFHALVKSGDAAMNLSQELTRFDHAGQRLILAEFPSIKPRDRAGFVRCVKLIAEQERANGWV